MKKLITLIPLITALSLCGSCPVLSQNKGGRTVQHAVSARLIVDAYSAHTMLLSNGDREVRYYGWLDSLKRGDTTVSPGAYPKLFHREFVVKGQQEIKEQFQDGKRRPVVMEATVIELPNGRVHLDFSRLGLLEPGSSERSGAERQPVSTSLTLSAKQPRVLRLPEIPDENNQVEVIVVALRLEQLSDTHEDKSSFEY